MSLLKAIWQIVNALKMQDSELFICRKLMSTLHSVLFFSLDLKYSHGQAVDVISLVPGANIIGRSLM